MKISATRLGVNHFRRAMPLGWRSCDFHGEQRSCSNAWVSSSIAFGVDRRPLRPLCVPRVTDLEPPIRRVDVEIAGRPTMLPLSFARTANGIAPCRSRMSSAASSQAVVWSGAARRIPELQSSPSAAACMIGASCSRASGSSDACGRAR